MSDSEDDFMSDKFLVDVAPSSKSYSDKRNAQTLKSLRASQAKTQVPLKQLEAERRREGLNRSLFDREAESSTSGGASKAMGMMMKMGWKVGDTLGKQEASRRSASPESSSKRARIDEDDDVPRGGLGRARAEPIRVSMWAGRKGLTARDPSPPPLPSLSGRNVDALDPSKLERLGRETEDFRARQRREFAEKEIERKEYKAREILVGFDRDKGIKFHPLHVLPTDPLGTLPQPLLKLIYPSQIVSPSRSPSPSEAIQGQPVQRNLTAAEKLREEMRRDMLTQLGGEEDSDNDEDDDLAFGKISRQVDEKPERKKQSLEDWDGIDWAEMVSGAKKVLSMEPKTHLTFLVDQLRHEYLFCFWCAHRYKSWEELEGPGGCPGVDEDDH
ncbi:hypothetical protein BCR39DRAFT_493693 [Naematelia encephala]|uniref:G-patch domain-containing protein n=1 Tax=Naematelia encephala TaxID=71784 RepID=A0A1Y2B9X6_9TREE|nr:hypothetical protein BCR39DRAFT_493693 [Naematelia encephala]